MKAKKSLALVLALMLTFTLFAGCGNNNQPASTASQSTSTPAPTPAPADKPSEKESQPAAAPSEAPPAPTGEPIKIGHIVDLTGVETMTGEEAKRSVEFAVESLGSQFAGRPVEIILGDAQNQPSVAVDVAKKMVEQDKVVAILGPTQIGQKSAVSEYMATVGVPLIFYNPTPIFLMKSNEWLVGSAGATPQLPTVMADYAYNELGYRTINTICPDNTGARSFVDPFVATFEKLGGTVVQQQFHPVPCPDFATYLATLKDADALVAWNSGSDAIALWNAWHDMGINKKMPIVAAMHGGFTDYYISNAVSKSNPAAAEAMMGTFAPMMYTSGSQTPENLEFVKAWTAKFGSLPATNLPGDCYQAVLVLKAAVESLNGDTAPEKLIEAIFAADVTGPAGHLYFKDSHAATKDVSIVKTVKLADGSYNYEMVKTYKDVPPAGIEG